MRNYLKWIVPLLLPLFLIAAVTPTVLPGLKISQYPNKATPGSTDLFVMECPSPATNYNISAFQLKFWITNGFSGGTTVNTNVLATTNYVNAAVSNALRGEVWTNDGTFVFYKNTQVSNTAPVLFRSDGSLFTGSNVWKDLDISDATVITPFYNFETNVVDLVGGMTLADTEDYNFYSFWDVRALRDSGGSGHFSMTLSASIFDTNFSSIDFAARRDSIIAVRDWTGYVMSLQPQHNTVGEAPYFFGTTFSQTGDLMVWSNANSRAASLSNNGDGHFSGRLQETMPGSGSIVAADPNGAHYRTNVTSGTSGNSSRFSGILPASIRDRSSRLLIKSSSWPPALRMRVASSRLWASASSLRAFVSSSLKPMTVMSGERISWLINERKRLLASLASLAFSSASMRRRTSASSSEFLTASSWLLCSSARVSV